MSRDSEYAEQLTLESIRAAIKKLKECSLKPDSNGYFTWIIHPEDDDE